MIQVIFQPLDQAIETNFGRIGNEAGDGIVQIVFDGLDDLWDHVAPQFLALVVDVFVIAAAEVNPLETASGAFSG